MPTSYSDANKTKNTDYLLAYNIGVMSMAVKMSLWSLHLEAEIKANSKQAVGSGLGADGCIALGFYFGVVTEQAGCFVQRVIHADSQGFQFGIIKSFIAGGRGGVGILEL